jgi:hypothetical protein
MAEHVAIHFQRVHGFASSCKRSSKARLTRRSAACASQPRPTVHSEDTAKVINHRHGHCRRGTDRATHPRRHRGGRPRCDGKPATGSHLHASAAKLVAYAVTKPIDQKLYSHRNTASSKRRHPFWFLRNKMGEGNLALSRFLARARLPELRCLVVHMHRSEGRVPRCHRCSDANELLPMAHHWRSTDSAVAIGLRLRDKRLRPC